MDAHLKLIQVRLNNHHIVVVGDTLRPICSNCTMYTMMVKNPLTSHLPWSILAYLSSTRDMRIVFVCHGLDELTRTLNYIEVVPANQTAGIMVYGIQSSDIAKFSEQWLNLKNRLIRAKNLQVYLSGDDTTAFLNLKNISHIIITKDETCTYSEISLEYPPSLWHRMKSALSLSKCFGYSGINAKHVKEVTLNDEFLNACFLVPDDGTT